MPPNGNNCVSNVQVCTLLNMHRPQIKGKQLFLSQMHDLKASCTFLEGREGKGGKGKEGKEGARKRDKTGKQGRKVHTQEK